MPGAATVRLTQTAYQAMLTHIQDLEDRVAALEADDVSILRSRSRRPTA